MDELRLFRLECLPDKGHGLVARRDIQPGELIIKETPLLKVKLTDEGDLLGKFNAQKQEFIVPSLLVALNELPDNDLFKFYSLSDSCSASIAQEYGLDSSDQVLKGLKTNYGIVKTNSFSMEFEAHGTCLALFPTIARLNHSCAPNCHHYWSGSEFKVRAVRPIKKNEEFTISYMSPLQRSDFHTRSSRRQILREEFGFFCHCNLCSDEEIIDVAQNDADRTRLLEIEQAWSSLGQDPDAAMLMAEEQFAIGQSLNLQPGLLAYIALHCVEASSLLITSNPERSGLRQKGLDFAQIAENLGVLAYGKNTDETELFSRIRSLWESSPDEDLFSLVQRTISKLRDIDKQ